MRRGMIFLALGLIFLAALPAAAQQVTVQTPFHSVSDSFFERNGVNWGLRFKGGGFMTFGTPNAAAPQFGGYDPSAGLQSGFGFNRGDVRGNLNFGMAQGSRRSFVSQTPVVTTWNGMPAYVSDSSVSPFVISYIPVVGNYPAVPVVVPQMAIPQPVSNSGVGSDAVRSALQRGRQPPPDPRIQAAGLAPPPPPEAAAAPRRAPRPHTGSNLNLVSNAPAPASPVPVAAARESSAGRPAPSVAEARQMRAAEAAGNEEEMAIVWEQGANAERNGNLGAARVYYQRVGRHASGDLKQRALDRLSALQTQPNGRP